MTKIEVARAFIDAARDRQADRAADLCAEDVEILLPGADAVLRGKDGVRQMVRMAPHFESSVRSEDDRDGVVRVTTLTRFPGTWATYTTWLFIVEEEMVKRLTFELRAAN